MIESLSDDENVRIMVEQLGMREDQARMALGLARGTTQGDVVLVPGGAGPDGGEAQPAGNGRARDLVTALFRVARALVGREAA